MTDLPKNLTSYLNNSVRRAHSADLLSHVLAQLRLTGEEMKFRNVAPNQTAGLNLELAHIVVVEEGALMLDADGATMVIAAGDLLLLPHGISGVRLKSADVSTTFIDCSFWFDPDSLRGMLLALPPWIHLRKEDGAPWLEGMIGFLMVEAGDLKPGAALMISRLIDLVVIRTLRSWVHQGNTSGWLGGLVDARIARAVKAIHQHPNQCWSIDALAKIAGMGRSTFSERFTTLVGRSPQRYSNEWRLALARDLLGKPDARVGQVGLSIGYRSEAAFSRAYKALYGHSPRDELSSPGHANLGPQEDR
jgi:AraC-like DNA-binding protein